MDLHYIGFVARCFAKLMRKRYIISSEELQLDWKPLYKTYERLLFSEAEALGLRFVPENLETDLSQAIRAARPHFRIEATQEMLEEWRPMLCPYSDSIQRAVTYLNLFLPTTLPPDQQDKGFKLWFDEVMHLWLCGKVIIANYESKLTLLLSRLSSDCMGYIDWEPYIARIFNHFKSNLNLSGGISKVHVRRNTDSVDFGPCIQWMVYMISQENSCLEHISKLFKAIESFYHPSNTDRRWHSKLQQFLCKLPACYVKRLYRERYKNNIWSRRIPENYRLTDEQTNKFVDALLPVALTSMFNQSGLSSAALAFRDLSVLRPEKVVPPLLDRLYGSYETLTEPHRLLASINCMASVVPAMVRPCKYFPEGPSHVVPLLLNSLPGLDSNDMRKCVAVFRFIATIAAHVRMRDYSYLVDERADLTIEQQELCLSTSQFEDFVIQFLDKCFVLIENTATTTFSSLDQDKETYFKNGEEGVIEAAISSVALGILAQASPQIQQAALDKIYSHVTRHIFDTKTQGKAIASLCLACAKANPKESLAKLIPHFSRLIITLTDNEEVFQESILDEELLFSLLLMAEIVRCNSVHLLDYREQIVAVLERGLKLRAKEGYLLTCGIMRHLLRALTSIGCCDWRNIDLDDEENRAKEEKWPFDNWGHTTHIRDLKLRWEIPGPESRRFAQELLDTFLKSAVKDLTNWSQAKVELRRERVHCSLHVILSSLYGAASVLPSVISETIDLCPLEVPVVPLCIKNTGTEPLNFSDGTNIRVWVVESLKPILAYIQNNHQDDSKSLTLICEALGMSISYYGYSKPELRVAAQRIKSLKSGTQNKLLGTKRHLRYLLVERVAQQHRAMLLNKGSPEFTKLHLDVFKDLFELAQSHYVEVRVLAQEFIYLMLNYFPFSETILVPMVVSELRIKEIEHKKFKGLLYLVLGKRSCNAIMIDPNWNFLKELWPALVESPHSEKPSIVKLIDRISSLVQKGFDTFELNYDFPENIKKLANEIWSSGSIDSSEYQAPDEKLIMDTKIKTAGRNKQRKLDYETLVLKLVELIENPRLHWHRRMVAFNLFAHLMRDDHPLPLDAVKLCISSLISERIQIRSKATLLVVAQLKLIKPKYKKYKGIALRSNNNQEQQGKLSLAIDQLEVGAGNISLEEKTKSPEDPDDEIIYLDGNSNKWMQYELRDKPYSKEEWEKLIFIDKHYIGFYDWPKEIKIHKPTNEQIKPYEEMSDVQKIFVDFMNNHEFVEKLAYYFSFEENKYPVESYRFDSKRPAFFNILFCNFGWTMTAPFMKYIEEFAVNTCEQKRRMVIEFMGGLIRGSKHWNFEDQEKVRVLVTSLMDKMVFSQENMNDWIGMCNYAQRHRDAKRVQWFVNYLINRATSPEESNSPTVTPFMLSSRLSMAYYSLNQCEWRAVDNIFPKVLENLRDQNHLVAYTNVRQNLSSIHSLIYMFDDPTALSKIPGTLANASKRAKFIDHVLPKLAILEEGKIPSKRLVVAPDNLSSTEIHSGTPTLLPDITKSRYASDIHATAEPSANKSLPIPDEEVDVGLLAESIMKFRPDLDTNPDSPPSIGSHHVRGVMPHSSKVGKEDSADGANQTSSVEASVTPFDENLRNTIPNLNVHPSTVAASATNLGDLSGESQERKDAMTLMKFTACWVLYNVVRMKQLVPAELFRLLPVICEMGRDNADPELAADSLAAVAILGSATLSPEAVSESLKYVKVIIANHSWHARVAAAAFLEMMVSSNMFQLMNKKEWLSEIEDIVINQLIRDERIEVRESSSLTLSGMIHCEFTKLTPELIQEFLRRANEPLVKRKQPNGTTVIDSKSIVTRHSGILCLCACVDAHPYSVPEYLPEILIILSDHLTDPQPISVSKAVVQSMSVFCYLDDLSTN